MALGVRVVWATIRAWEQHRDLEFRSVSVADVRLRFDVREDEWASVLQD